jgi:hypothetical protein
VHADRRREPAEAARAGQEGDFGMTGWKSPLTEAHIEKLLEEFGALLESADLAENRKRLREIHDQLSRLVEDLAAPTHPVNEPYVEALRDILFSLNESLASLDNGQN